MRSIFGGLIGMGAALLLAGCGADTGDAKAKATDGTTLADSETLSVGSEGEAVRAVHRYLKQFGYLPNEQLQQEYPSWRSPVESSPARDDVYDDSTLQGVLAMQRAFGLEESGEVDAATKAIMLQARCGVPELAPVDETAKWDVYTGPIFVPKDLTWKVIDALSCGLTQAQADASVTTGLRQWAAPTPYTFTKVGPNDAAAIEIRCSSTNPSGAAWGPTILAQAKQPNQGSDVWINSNLPWTIFTPPEANKYDFQSVVVHEVGHALGLNHSSVISKAVMYPSINIGVAHRILENDDLTAGLALGTLWQAFDWESYDIDASSFGSVRQITVTADPPIPGGYTVWRLFKNNWTPFPGQGGVRVSSGGSELWIVQDDGDIYEWVTDQWLKRPGCAKDVSVGGDSSVWIVSCTPAPNGFEIRKWDGANFVTAVGGQGGWRISVGRPNPTSSINVPWIVNAEGGIYRRTSNLPSSGSYEALPGSANDIAVSPYGAAWVISKVAAPGGYEIYTWNEQVAINGAANQRKWYRIDGNAINISVDIEGYPVVVNSFKTAFVTQ